MSRYLGVENKYKIDVEIDEYNRNRKINDNIRCLCLAPFVNLDLNPLGQVAVCNHIFGNLGNIQEYDGSINAVWNSERIRRVRKNFIDYKFMENCKHCIHQAETKNIENIFSIQHFDHIAPENLNIKHPTRLILRLNSTCNMACVMCDEKTSSRVRTIREKKPKLPSMYNETFFNEIDQILPKIKHIEFYGGEPFLVKEHIRIFDMMMKKNLRTQIYVNTNLMSLNNKTKEYLKKLNFKHIAVSMDAFHKEVHESIRVGIRHDVFIQNFEWLISLARKKKIFLNLNVTEHRKNWFDLPNVFDFAEKYRVPIHINHCISPENITLYNLSIPEMRYVLESFEKSYRNYLSKYSNGINRGAYQNLIQLLDGEIDKRQVDENKVYYSSWKNSSENEYLSAPVAGLEPFEDDDKMSDEIRRILKIHSEKFYSKQYMLENIKMQMKDDRFAEWNKCQMILDEKGRLPKIIFTTYDWGLSGVNTCVMNLILGLDKIGFDCELLVTPYYGWNLKQEKFPENIKIKYLDVSKNDLWEKRWQKLTKYLEKSAPCIVVPGYTNGYSGIAPLLSQNVGIAGVVHSDDPDHYDHVERLGKYWNAIIVVSDYLKEEVVKINPNYKEKIFTIPCPVYVPEKYDRKIINDTIKIVYVGRVVQYQKRIYDTVKIIEELNNKNIKYEFTIIGDGEQFDDVKHKLKQFIKKGIVKLTGRIDNEDTIKHLIENHVFLLNSDFEGMPVSLMEAMSHGCVPVVSRIKSGIKQLVKDDYNGYFAEIGNIKQFAEIIVRIYQYPEKYEELSKNAYDSMKKSGFDTYEAAKKYGEVFQYIKQNTIIKKYDRPEPYRPFCSTGKISIPPWMQHSPDEIIKLRNELEMIKKKKKFREKLGFKKMIKENIKEKFNMKTKKSVELPTKQLNAVFLIGCHRSGTTVTVNKLGDNSQVVKFNENNDKAFKNYRLKDRSTIEKILINECADHKKWALFKSLADTFRGKQLLETYEGSKIIFLFRKYDDVINSMFKFFKNDFIGDNIRLFKRVISGEFGFYKIYKNGTVNQNARRMILELFHPKLNKESIAALYWLHQNILYFDMKFLNEERVHLCCYESIMNKPVDEMKKLSRFLDVKFEEKRMIANLHRDSINKKSNLELDPYIERECVKCYNSLLNLSELD